MSKNNVQNVGRIYYVDPNNAYNDIPNGIPHPYEDYCISVDLTVRFGDRNSCGPWGNKAEMGGEYTFSSDRGTINFIGGTDGYLTTNWTDIESTNPDANTNECLGIESINIAYNSWYVPQVSIRFVDVRGASLMAKQEQGYKDTLEKDLKTGHADNTKIDGGSFFKALFSFPYPMFKLKVKGFYGREVTYNLAVEDFQGSFNSETGNFEVDVKFIGYMFGVYTDIPMNYLMISPYFDSECGKGYWDAQKENGRFKYYNAAPFYTYPELVRKLAGIDIEPPKTDGNGENLQDKKIELENRISALHSIKEDINNFLRVPFDGGFGFGKLSYKEVKEGGKSSHVFLFGISKDYGAITFNETTMSPYRVANGGLIYDAKKDYDLLINRIKAYNDKYPNHTLSENLNQFGLSVGMTPELNSKEVKIQVSGTQGQYNGNIEYDFVEGRRLTTKEWVDNKIKENGYNQNAKIYVYVPENYSWDRSFAVPDWLFDIDDMISTAQNELNTVLEGINNNTNKSISQALGFGTSVGNAFRMSFAHMETFINIFNEYLRRIYVRKGTDSRTLAKLGCDLSNTDLSSKFKSSTSVPPFTMFYKEVESDDNGTSSTNEKSGKKKVPMWPGDLPGDTSGLDEIEFVNKLLDAAKFYSAEMQKTQDYYDALKESEAMATSSTQVYVPTTIYDLTHTASHNPYSYLTSISNGNQQWEGMMITFFLRLLAWASSGYNEKNCENGKGLEAFGRIEAYNIFKAHTTLPKNIMDFIKDRMNMNPDDFVKEMTLYILSDSDEDRKKLFDKGYGFKPHMIRKDSSDGKTGYYEYDWAEADYYDFDEEGNRVRQGIKVEAFPVANESPEFMDPDSTHISNEKFIYLDKIDTYETDESLRNYKTTYVIPAKTTTVGGNVLNYKNDYLSIIEMSDKLSKYKKDYENYVLPDLSVPDFVVGFGNNATQRERNHAVVIVSSRNAFTRNDGGDGVKLPKKREDNANDFYVQCPAYIKVQEGASRFSYYQLYGHPFFYAQNEEADLEKRNLAKAFLFAAGMPAEPVKNGNSNVRPFIVALSQGAHMFRQKYELEHNEPLLIVPPGYYVGDLGNFASTSPSNENYFGEHDETFCVYTGDVDESDVKRHDPEDLIKYEDGLIELFEDWAKNDFPQLNDIFELKVPDARNYEGFKSLIEEIADQNSSRRERDKLKFGVMFSDRGSYNDTFYDADAKLFVKNNTALDFQAKKKSDFQNEFLDEHICKFVMVFNTANISHGGRVKIKADGLYQATRGFFKGLIDIFGNQIDNWKGNMEANSISQYDPARDKDLKLSTYMTLKTLYDRWICMNREFDRWKLDAGEVSEFSQFRFVDGFYRNIEKRIAVNFNYVGEIAQQMMASSNITNDATSLKYQGRSFYDFLASICQKNQMMLLSLPMENEFTNPEGIRELFDVKPYSQTDTRDTSCFVCLYSNKPSEHLEIEYDNEEYLYATDGFNIANSRGEVLEQDLRSMPQLSDTDVDGYKIPAFGVAYGKQNQSIFKRVTVNMQNPQVTEASIAATQLIASKGNLEPNQTVLYGQDLYRIYSNYSYTCSVDMMGNAQIMPMTYFQLQNIPLFRGAYMIINIEHSISAGEMNTRFTGVRMSRYDTPLVSDYGTFTDPFLETNYHSGMEPGNWTSNANTVSDEKVKDVKNNIIPGQHKYTVTMGDLLWSNGMESYNAKHPDNKLSNNPTAEHLENLTILQTKLQQIEDAWVVYCSLNPGEPFAEFDGIKINSGYRSAEKNALGHSVNQQAGSSAKPHTLGHAADIKVCKYDTSKANSNAERANLHNGTYQDSDAYTVKYFLPFLVKYLRENNEKWGQIIDEKANTNWVHYAYCTDSGGYKNEVLRYRNGKYTPATIR